MSKAMTQERALEIARTNIEVLSKLSKAKYPYLYGYLYGHKMGRQTTGNKAWRIAEYIFRFILGYEREKPIQIRLYRHMYTFFLPASFMPARAFKQLHVSEITAFQYVKLLCALRILKNVWQDAEDPKRLESINNVAINAKKAEGSHDKAAMNYYSFYELTSRKLAEAERRAKILRKAGITASKLHYTTLCNKGLPEIGQELYPNNNPSAPERKAKEYKKVIRIIEHGLDESGYITKDMIKSSLINISDKELDKVFRDFGLDLEEKYLYHSPTGQEMEKYNLPDRRWIYTRRELVN